MKRLVGLLHSSGQSSAEPDVTAHPTPIWISKRTRTALILAVVIVLGFVIWYVPSVFTTVVGGFALALALSFPVRWLSWFMPRGLSILLSVWLVVLVALFLVPLVGQQLSSLADSLPGIANTAERYLSDALNFFQNRGLLPSDPNEIASRIREDLTNAARAIAGNVLGGALNVITGTFSFALTTALLTALLFLGIQQLEGNFLTPKIQGDTLRVHPVLVFLVIIVGGGLCYRLQALAECSAKSFARHDMAVYAMALAYRGLLALLPFTVSLVAVLSFLRVDAVLAWLAEKVPAPLYLYVAAPAVMEAAAAREGGACAVRRKWHERVSTNASPTGRKLVMDTSGHDPSSSVLPTRAPSDGRLDAALERISAASLREGNRLVERRFVRHLGAEEMRPVRRAVCKVIRPLGDEPLTDDPDEV